MTLHLKMAIPDLQWYPWKLKNLVFISVSFSAASLKQEMRYSRYRREPADKNEQFTKTKTLKSISYLIRQSFFGYCCKSEIDIYARGCVCVWGGGSRVITLSVHQTILRLLFCRIRCILTRNVILKYFISQSLHNIFINFKWIGQIFLFFNPFLKIE